MELCKNNMVDAVFEQFKDKQRYVDALRRAAEEMYRSEMVDTEMDILEIKEIAEHGDYANDNEYKNAIENCTWATKEDWILDKLNEWMNPEDF